MIHALAIATACVAVLFALPAEAQPAPAPPPPLVKFEVKNGAIPASLTGKPGDPAKGRAVIAGPRLGNLLACHEVEPLKDELFHGNTGPDLTGVASRS
ncbi:MAG: hypothetical protein ACT4P2_04510 [Pseudomonadota bacterium]